MTHPTKKGLNGSRATKGFVPFEPKAGCVVLHRLQVLGTQPLHPVSWEGEYSGDIGEFALAATGFTRGCLRGRVAATMQRSERCSSFHFQNSSHKCSSRCAITILDIDIGTEEVATLQIRHCLTTFFAVKKKQAKACALASNSNQ